MNKTWHKKQCVVAVALQEAADVLEREAAELRREAIKREDAYLRQRRRQDLPAAIKLYIQHLTLGHDHRNALKSAANRFSVPEITLQHAVFENEKAMRAYYLWKRNRRIVTLAERYSNRELAQKFNLSEGRISQIIGIAFGRTSASGHRKKRYLIPDADLLPHHRANQRALKRREKQV